MAIQIAVKSSEVSILGLARSPTVLHNAVPHVHLQFQYLGSRGAQLQNLIIRPQNSSCFNTWAREEPNIYKGRKYSRFKVSILGLARSPTRWVLDPARIKIMVSILGLARSPTPRQTSGQRMVIWFQYLGSRGAQPRTRQGRLTVAEFQYLGSRGAQLTFAKMMIYYTHVSILGLARSPTDVNKIFAAFCDVSILGLARSPTKQNPPAAKDDPVSILGLARSPTCICSRGFSSCSPFQYLGSRGAQLCVTSAKFYRLYVSILGLARSPTGSVL